MNPLKQLLANLCVAVALVSATQASTVIDSLNDISTNGNVTTWAAINNTAIRSDTGPTAGGVGFLSGFGQASGVPCYETNDLAVGMTNYVSGQGSTVRHWSVGPATGSQLRRTQTRTTPTFNGSGSVIWFSFLVSLQNPHGDAALVFNPYVNGSGQALGYGYTTPPIGPGPAAPGLRIGVGNANSTLQGALGIGPFEGANYEAGLTNITSVTNGAVTAAGFVPTNGTAGLVLGCIYSTNGYQAVSVWYNPNVTNQASLPAPTLTFIDTNALFVPSSVSSLGYEVFRDTAVDELIDNVKVSDELNGFNIVYQNASLATTTVSLMVSNMYGSASEPAPSNIVFNVESSQAVTGSPLSINYTLSGVASQGVDYNDALNGTVTIPVGQTNALVTIVPIAETNAEGNLPVTITLTPSSGFALGASSTGTGYILASNTANVSLQYMFTETMAPQIWDTNLLATSANAPILGNQAMSQHYFVSKDAAYIASEAFLTNNEAGAVANSNYVSMTISPVSGRAMTLTNLNFDAVYGNYLYDNPGASGATVFVRSSLDNFATDLATWSMLPDNETFPVVFQNYSLDLGSAFANQLGNVEFRIYFYSDVSSTNALVGVFMDNLYFNGSTVSDPGAAQVSVVATTPNASEPNTAGQFTITRTGSTAGALPVYYAMSGTASNGVDYAALSGTATIAAGQSNVVVSVQPQGTYFTSPTVTATMTLLNNSGYGIRTPSSDTVSIAIGAELPPGELVTYGFNENNNSAASLSAVAKGTVSVNYSNEVTAANALAGAGLGPFGGAENAASVGNEYGSSAYVSAPSTLVVIGSSPGLGTNEQSCVASNAYVSFVISPQAGYALTLTNFTAWVKSTSSSFTGNTNAYFLRSSLDGFTSDLGAITNYTDTNSSDPFTRWTVPLNISNFASSVEFRMYFYIPEFTPGYSDLFRVDDATFYGVAGVAPVLPSVSVVATTPNASEAGTAGQFTITRTGSTASALAVYYSMSGTASNGVDYASLPGVATIAAGQSSAPVTVQPQGDYFAGASVSAVLTLTANANYSVVVPSADTVTISNGGELPAGELLVYGFNEDNNSAASLSAVAAAVVAPGVTNEIQALNASSGAGLGAFGTNILYGTSQFYSAPSALAIAANTFMIGTGEQTAVNNNCYLSFVVQPRAGYRMTLTNLSAWVKSTSNTNGDTNIYFLRSSADNFTSDLGSITNAADTNSTDAFIQWNIPLKVTNYPGPIEFRMYLYTPVWIYGYSDYIRVDDVTLNGTAGANPAGSQVVTVTASTPNASESGSPGAFTLARYGDASGALSFTYAMSGTATNGVDYVFLSGSTNFAAGVTNLVIPIVPKGDQLTLPSVTATLTALTDAGLPASATVTITNGSGVNSNPTNIVSTVSHGALVLSWPADHTGWRLLVQTNSLSQGLGTNWVSVPNSNLGDSYTNAINPANGSVFYRLVYP